MARRPTRDPYARPAIQTPERLHSKLGGKILENKQEHANLAEQMRHVEAVIRMLDPGYSLRAISVKRRTPNSWFKRGTVYRRAVDVLRGAAEPLTALEIAERVLVAAKVDNPKKAAVADLTGRYWPACGITSGRASSGPMRVARPGGSWPPRTGTISKQAAS
jgi:hypothetical protein